MKIAIELNERVKTEAEVKFPFYRKHELDNSTIYMKVESQVRQISINLYDNRKRVEIEIESPSWYGGKDYLLGQGEHKSSKEEFEGAVLAASVIIADAAE